MKSIIANPHNGAPVNINGVLLMPGFSLDATPATGEAAKKGHEFLAVTTDAGAFDPKKAKPVALKVHLEWSHVTPPDTDPGPQIVVHGSKPLSKADKVVAPRKAAAKKARR